MDNQQKPLGAKDIAVRIRDFMEKHRRGETVAIGDFLPVENVPGKEMLFQRLFQALLEITSKERWQGLVEVTRIEWPEYREIIEELLECATSDSANCPEHEEDSQSNFPQEALPLPVELGDWYNDLQSVGSGGYGEAYRATQLFPKREVVLKITKDTLGTSEEVERFQREADILAKLSHPNIVPVYQSGTLSDGRHFYSMKYIKGKRLWDGIDDIREVTSAVRIMLEITRAIEYIHQNQFLHNDISGANILLEQDAGTEDPIPVIIDFGLAQGIQGCQEEAPIADKAPRYREKSRTEGFHSPEHLGYGSLSVQSDIFSLGAVFYFLLHHKTALSDQQPECGPYILKKQQRQIPFFKDLKAILAKCTQPKVTNRYETVGALRRDLENFLNHRPVSVRAPRIWDRSVRLGYRFPVATGIVSLALLLILVLSVVFSVYQKHLRNQTEKVNEALKAETLKHLASVKFTVETLGDQLRRHDEFDMNKRLWLATVRHSLHQRAEYVQKLAEGKVERESAAADLPRYEQDLNRILIELKIVFGATRKDREGAYRELENLFHQMKETAHQSDVELPTQEVVAGYHFHLGRAAQQVMLEEDAAKHLITSLTIRKDLAQMDTDQHLKSVGWCYKELERLHGRLNKPLMAAQWCKKHVEYLTKVKHANANTFLIETEKIEAHLRLIRWYRESGNPQSGRDEAVALITFLRQQRQLPNNSEWILRAHMEKAKTEAFIGETDYARNTIHQAQQYLNRLPSQSVFSDIKRLGKADLLELNGFLYLEERQLAKAEEAFSLALTLRKNGPCSLELLARTYGRCGVVAALQLKLQTAVDFHQKEIQLLREFTDNIKQNHPGAPRPEHLITTAMKRVASFRQFLNKCPSLEELSTDPSPGWLLPYELRADLFLNKGEIQEAIRTGEQLARLKYHDHEKTRTILHIYMRCIVELQQLQVLTINGTSLSSFAFPSLTLSTAALENQLTQCTDQVLTLLANLERDGYFNHPETVGKFRLITFPERIQRHPKFAPLSRSIVQRFQFAK